MRIGVDLDDVTAECAVPYLRKFAEEFGITLPEQDLGWHLLRTIDDVPDAEKDRFRMALYDGAFFSELEPYADCPGVLEALASAGHELYFVTARAERRRVVTEAWLREKGLLQHARAVHLKPHGDFDPSAPRGRYDATSSARYKLRIAEELRLEAFCEDDETIAAALAAIGLTVYLFDRVWNRGLEHPNIVRVADWTAVGRHLGLR
ncbi:MAG TPA: hypothetical protein VIN34_07705 [Candidatus Limnocylindria bacterium]|jgi:uncharacterized HAD superfamily protein